MSSAPRKARAPSKLSHLAHRRLRMLGFDPARHAWMTANLGRQLGAVDRTTTKPYAGRVTSATGFELACSYNWRRSAPSPPPSEEDPEQAVGREKEKEGGRERRPALPLKRQRPQIFVPGEAPRVVPHRLPLSVPPTMSLHSLRDYNAAWMPRSPFEAMFRAIEVMRPGLKLDDVDIVANRSSLSHLLRVVRGGCTKPYRLDLCMVNNSLVVTPKWPTLYEPRSNNYGRLFEQNFTRPAPEMHEAGSHHRAILYHLGPLRCLVLLEVDAALARFRPAWTTRNWSLSQMAQELTPAQREQVQAVREQHTPLQSDAERRLFQSLLNGGGGGGGDNDDRFEKDAPKRPRDLRSLTLLRKGGGTLSAHTAELLTTSSFESGDTKTQQMWLGRTPYLVKSLHRLNTFTDVRVSSSWPRLVRFEENAQESLQKLVSAIQMLRDLTSSTVDRHAIGICTPQAKSLKVFEPRETSRMPLLAPSIQERFWTRASRSVSPFRTR